MGVLLNTQVVSSEETSTETFGMKNFGTAALNDKRRTDRLVRVADALSRRPGGSLPEKLVGPGELDGLYHLMSCPSVTHESVLAPHRRQTLQKLAAHKGYVLILHDTTELDFTTHPSLTDRGPIGNGSHQGWLCHNALAVDPLTREVLGIAGQILHCRAQPPARESTAAKRGREDRESRLWVWGTQHLPSDRKIVDVCDRGADAFEFLEHEVNSGRTFVVRSARDRSVLPDHAGPAEKCLLHAHARRLAPSGTWTLDIPAARIERNIKSGKNRNSKKVIENRKRRQAVLQVSSAAVRVCAPQQKRGEHGGEPLLLWVVRVWEPNPPEGVEGLEWMLLTNHSASTFDAAQLVKNWYECRWIVEEFHKSQKTGCNIEDPQFNTSDRLHPMIALQSVVALTLLNLRELSRREDARIRPATDVVSLESVETLSAWRHQELRPNWTVHEFCLALARLGGHRNRTGDSHPGWIVLWKGWSRLQAMLEGARAQRIINKCA